MTTATEMAGVIDWIKDRWPTSSAYRQWERVVHDFTAIPVTAVSEAARLHYEAGNKIAPTFAELRAEAARLAAQGGLIDPQASSCDVVGHSRNWAITELADGMRSAECVACGTVIIKKAAALPTVGEAAIIAKEGRMPAEADELADRIAP